LCGEISLIVPAYFPPKKILFATDGSDNARRAEEAAAILAKSCGSELLILNVYSIPFYAFSSASAFGGMPPINIKELMETAEQQAKKLVDESQRRVESQGIRTTGKVLEAGSSVVYEIVSFAQNENVDLIVVGTRGMGGFKKLLLGSVSSGVVSHAHCNIMVVK
jgi:nucleotide-binding universal stress UspA family protein